MEEIEIKFLIDGDVSAETLAEIMKDLEQLFAEDDKVEK